jgi:hypothetical protein
VVFKLLKLDTSHLSELGQNTMLKRYGLMSCTSRFFVRISLFIHRIVNSNYLAIIKDKLILSSTLNNYNLRSRHDNTSLYYQNNSRTKHGEHCLSNFIVKFINLLIKDSIFYSCSIFKNFIMTNLIEFSTLFITLF